MKIRVEFELDPDAWPEEELQSFDDEAIKDLLFEDLDSLIGCLAEGEWEFIFEECF